MSALPPLQLPLSASKISFLFDGLFFFCFHNYDAGDKRWEECQVGIHPTAPDHPLRIIINAPSGQKVFDMSEEDHWMSQWVNNIYLEKSTSGGVIRRDDAIDRQKPEINSDSFKWVIDFENHEMHNLQLVKQPEILRPVLHFKDGDFYTARVNNCKQYIQKIVNGMSVGSPRDFGFVARIIGAKIDLELGTALLLKTGGGVLKLAENTTGVTAAYTIRLLNNDAVPHPSSESDIKYFYDFLTDKTGIRFEFIPVDKNCKEKDDLTAAVHPYVCYGTTGSKTENIP